MYLLNNIHDRRYCDIYPDLRNVAFDISENQLSNQKNGAWKEIERGCIVCVVNGTRKISTFRRVDARLPTDVIYPSHGRLFVITGQVVGKLPQDLDMTTLFNKYHLKHPYLPGNQFSIGFNVGNLGDALDNLVLTTKNGDRTVLELKRGAS